MKKTAMLLVAILVLSVFAFASCDKLPWGKKECKEHIDANGDYVCDKCETEIKKPDVPPSPPASCEHKDDNKDHKCDTCEEEMGKHEAPAGKHKCEYCGEAFSYCTDDDKNNLCDLCGVDVEHVSYSLNVSDIDVGKRSEDDIQGKFTILAETEVRTRTRTFEDVEYTKSIKMGSDKNGIAIDVPGNGTLEFLIQNGSSGKEYQSVLITSPDGKSREIKFEGTISSSPVVKLTIDVTPGVWTIRRIAGGGTIDVYKLDMFCVVEKSEECGFELVTTGNVDYLMGAAIDTSGLRLIGVYGSGKTEPLSADDYAVDMSKVDTTKSGVYEVTISYKEYEPIKYNVYVYEPSALKLGFDAIEQIANSSVGNGVYFNHSFKEIYSVGEELDETGLSVIVIASCGEKSIEVKTSAYTISGFDSSSAGEKSLTVTHTYAEGKSVSASTTVHVVNAEPSIVKDVYQVKVDADYEGVIGAVADGYNMFTTVQQALDFLADAPVASKKLVEIEEGYYREKLEITIPNLTIKGVGADKVTIEWDSLYGIEDDGGFVHTTDSTATVAVREGALNTTIEGVTISNAYNSKEYFDEKLGENYGEHRALALLVQSDRFVMRNGALLGYQDTVEFFTGRQYLENVYIQGLTDFIFGTNSTTFFNNCEIHSISIGKTDGGYVTAFKGCNKGSGDWVQYGAIFYKCSFTAPDDVVANGNTAIGRCWAEYAAVAVIECELDGHISLKGFSGSSKNERYVSMNAKPDNENVKFVEYGNTGAGALTAAVKGMKMLTAEEAALYSDFSVIFGKTNGKVTYIDPWDPNAKEEAEDNRTYYYFDGTTGITGSFYNYDQKLEKTQNTVDFNGLIIDATSSKVSYRSENGDTQVNAGAKFIVNVKGGTLVTVETYETAAGYLIGGVGSLVATESFSRYFAEDTEVVIEVVKGIYLHKIIIDPNADAPEAAELSEIKAEGIKTEYTVGDELSLEGATVTAYYSDDSFAILSSEDYTIDSSAVNNAAAGTYNVVFKYGEKTANVELIFEADSGDPAITKDTVLEFTSSGYSAVKNNSRVTIEEINVYANGNGNEYYFEGTVSFMVKAGTRVSVNPYYNSQYVAYTLGVAGAEGLETKNSFYTFVAEEDCTVVYTGLSGNYLVSIIVNCPGDAVTKEDVKVTFNTSGNYADPPAAVDTLEAVYKQVKSDCAQFSSGNIRITLLAGASLNITNYGGGYTNYSVVDEDGNLLSPEGGVTGGSFSLTVTDDTVITLTPGSADNYIKEINITYPTE